MTTTKNKRGDRVTADQAMITGTQTFLAQLATLPVGGKNMTPADIVAVFQARIAKANAAITAEAAKTAAVKADHDERANTAVFVLAFRRIVLGMFQENPDTLAAFGMKAPKPHAPSAATLAAAVAKNKATRTARGTVGPKKKLAIKGTIPAAPAPAPTPAPMVAAPAAPVEAAPAPATPAPTPVVAAAALVKPTA